MNTLSVEALVDKENHAWTELRELLSGGKNQYRVIPPADGAPEETLYLLQVSTRSYLGTIAYETGGIVFDYGWLTLLGAGGEGVYGSLAEWNGLRSDDGTPPVSGLLVVAYDAAGGFFALDTGRFGRTGHIYYYAPDTLEWESTELAYSGFIGWLAEGDLDQFYATFRWEGWRNELSELSAGQVFSYYPPLWTAEGGGESSTKTPISVADAWKAVCDSSNDG